MKCMKTLIVTLLLLALTAASAFAGHPSHDMAAIPQDIQEFFASEKRSGYTILDYAILEGYCFVAARSGEKTNTMFGFKETEDGWSYWMKNQNALPQGGYDLWVNDVTGHTTSVGKSGERTYTLPTICIAQLAESNQGESVDRWVCYSLRNGAWQIEEDYYSFDTKIFFDANELIYWDGPDAYVYQGTINATVQRNIRYINLQNIPKKYADAKALLTAAPTLPASVELQAQEIKFTGGRKYDVYSAPTRASYRSANGKAVVSTNSWIQVFGVEDGWAMIQYSIDAENYRIGYIVEEALPANADVAYLDFAPVSAWTTRGVTLTDDPFYSGSIMTRLTNAVEVQWLATIGNWAYIEVTDGQLMRGFIPADALNTHMEFLPMVTPEPGK